MDTKKKINHILKSQKLILNHVAKNIKHYIFLHFYSSSSGSIPFRPYEWD